LAWDTITPYHTGFREFSQAFEAFGFEDVHKGSLPFLPTKPGQMLDIGAGSGRDAAWFARRGWDVVAVEPAEAMRAEAARLHAAPNIRWIADSIPALSHVVRLGLSFDLIWLSGVWMHVCPDERARSMRKLAMLLRPGGRLVMTLRHGPPAEDRPMWPVDAHEVERLGLDFGLTLRVATARGDDLAGQKDVSWQTVILDLPDDGSGALPLLRGVILRQEKSATYKLALLRAIARIADCAANVARERDDVIELPLGLIALYWVRMYKPLVTLGWSQRPGETIVFPDDQAYRLADIGTSSLRPGAQFPADASIGVHGALAKAARLIAQMPAKHMTYADDQPIFETSYESRRPPRGRVRIDQAYLWSFGTTRVPLPVWNALRRMAAWIEPMLVGEWARLMQGYAANRPRRADGDAMTALRWQEDERDTGFVRDLIRRRGESGGRVACVWTGAPVPWESLCIDHCLPWSIWECNDLWNLMPARRSVNAEKSNGLVTSVALSEAKPRILAWWEQTYVAAPAAVRSRFIEEAALSLPLQNEGGQLDLDDLFTALDFLRLRLKQDTGAPEWPKAKSAAGRMGTGLALP
jgi:SAM-dependent methyltransferase